MDEEHFLDGITFYGYDDPAESVDDLGIHVTPEGFLMQRYRFTYADGSEHIQEDILTIGCWDGTIPF